MQMIEFSLVCYCVVLTSYVFAGIVSSVIIYIQFLSDENILRDHILFSVLA